MSSRELPLPDQLLKARDRATIVYVPAATLTCVFCERERSAEENADEQRSEGVRTTVQWMGPYTDGPSGRCRECGQRFQLADARDHHIPEPEDQRYP